MFILLSGLAQTSHIDDIETRIGKTMRTSGIAVTITSLTDVIAFCAGASSLFPAVKHFSLYTGMLYYLKHIYICKKAEYTKATFKYRNHGNINLRETEIIAKQHKRNTTKRRISLQIIT